ncbi:hypothetical protein [Streptomyces sp. NPDC048496]|uniref:hypothetical protein n=1 Tax=Streptomyces sp. NPDC048496 TaxID=3365558 RepID=UPI0037147732
MFPDDDAKITVEDIEFPGIPCDSVPDLLQSVHTGMAHAKGTIFPPCSWLVVPLPGGETYKKPVPRGTRPPWLGRSVR